MTFSDLVHAFVRTRSGHTGQIIGASENTETGIVELCVKLDEPLRWKGIKPKDFFLHCSLEQCEGWAFAETREELQ